MSMADENDRDGFLQLDERRTLERAGNGAWTTVWEQAHDDDLTNVGRFCAFSSPSRREDALANSSWDLRIGSGGPGFVTSHEASEDRTVYSRFPGEDGVEPLILHRSFFGLRPVYIELAEEFRLFHNLCDVGHGQFVKIDEHDGTEAVAAEVGTRFARVSTLLLRQYQAARQLDLLLFVDSVRYARELPDGTRGVAEEIKTADVRATLYVGDLSLGQPYFSRLFGKKVIPAPPVETCGVWPYDKKPEHYPDFIIGLDKDAGEVRYSCDPDGLANYFGANPDAPHYLTPVHFRREVLQRYYEQPEKYSVGDGYLRCQGLWGLRMDNDHDQNVVVYLGDLGRDLPQRERDYWRPFNVPPGGRSISETAFRRGFLAQFADATSPDIVFRHLYERVATAWRTRFGWDLYRPPNPGDEHIVQRVRVPLTESDPEFDGQLLNIGKLMVDSLNDAALKSHITTDTAGLKSIAKLEAFLRQESYPKIDRDTEYLRTLQKLRSKGAAHLKGSDFPSVLKGAVGDVTHRGAITSLLQRGIDLLRGLTEHFGLADGGSEARP